MGRAAPSVFLCFCVEYGIEVAVYEVSAELKALGSSLFIAFFLDYIKSFI